MSRYQVWRKDDFDDCADEDERADRAWKPPVDSKPRDARQAAEWHAAHCHAQRDGWEWTWPVDFVVFDGKDHYVVEVERHTVPEFEADKPRKLVVAGGCSSVEEAPP